MVKHVTKCKMQRDDNNVAPEMEGVDLQQMIKMPEFQESQPIQIPDETLEEEISVIDLRKLAPIGSQMAAQRMFTTQGKALEEHL